MHYNISEGIFSILKYIHTYIVVTCLSAGLAVTRGQYLFWAFSQCVQRVQHKPRDSRNKNVCKAFFSSQVELLQSFNRVV